MRSLILFIALLPLLSFGQVETNPVNRSISGSYIKSTSNLTLAGALRLSELAIEISSELGKNISIAVLDSDGSIIIIMRGNDVGVHNTEASRRKAYTALSTKTATFELMQKAAKDSTANNLNTLPELLLLGGGVPIWNESVLIGSIGVSGAGGGLIDHNIAMLAIGKLGFATFRK